MSRKKVALFVNGYCGEIASQFMGGFWNNLEENTVDVYSFCGFPSLVKREVEMYGEMNIYHLPDMKDFDAAVIIANGLDFLDVCEDLYKKCVEANIPFIMTGSKKDEGHFIMSDNVVGTNELIKYVVEDLKCKDIAFLAGGRNNIDSDIRMKVIREYMRTRGLYFPETMEEDDTRLYYSNWEHQGAIDYILNIIKKDAIPDIIICANDELAMVSCNELEAHGYQVPQDVMVTGFDNSFFSKIYYPSISSVDQQYDKLGIECANIIKGIFAGDNELKEVVVPSKFCPKESTGELPDSDIELLRSKVGKAEFTDSSFDTSFSRKVYDIERYVLESQNFYEVHDNLKKAYELYEYYESDSFHIVLDERYRRSINDTYDYFKAYEYSESFDAVYSRENGVVYEHSVIDRHQLVPNIVDMNKNRYFLFAPLHEHGHTFGYMVLCDNIYRINNKNGVKKYEDSLSITFGRLVETLRLNDLNKKLLVLSQTDSLTHVKNRTAYNQKETEYDLKIANADSSLCFSIGVFDINNLKKINDTYGHEKGDLYIQNSCQFLCKAYKHSPVYRIGGDEFAVILTGADKKNQYEILNTMYDGMLKCNDTEELVERRISMAGGIAEYNPKTDKCFADVFKRADEIMYNKKAEMKGSV
ncbi:MAG: GGDEF domain-containing protein [Lachnospiraceae bacterium]|nr:GGDEF domain-containing protein [Lachnospiraceae bacterium]